MPRIWIKENLFYQIFYWAPFADFFFAGMRTWLETTRLLAITKV